MNFLAHLHISPNHDLVRVFNFTGDGYKGNSWKQHASPAELHGVGLHRFIDQFTDGHPLTQTALRGLRPTLGRVAGVALDLFGDYFLHKHWQEFRMLQPFTHEHTNKTFTTLCLQEIDAHKALLKGKAKNMAPHLLRENWIMSYKTLDGLNAAANGISMRHPVALPLRGYFEDLPDGHYDLAEQWMLDFYPELMRAGQNWSREMIEMHGPLK